MFLNDFFAYSFLFWIDDEKMAAQENCLTQLVIDGNDFYGSSLENLVVDYCSEMVGKWPKLGLVFEKTFGTRYKLVI